MSDELNDLLTELEDRGYKHVLSFKPKGVLVVNLSMTDGSKIKIRKDALEAVKNLMEKLNK